MILTTFYSQRHRLIHVEWTRAGYGKLADVKPLLIVRLVTKTTDNAWENASYSYTAKLDID